MRTASSLNLPALMTIPAQCHGAIWFWNVTENAPGIRHGVSFLDCGSSRGPRRLEFSDPMPTNPGTANASPAKLAVIGKSAPGPSRPRLKIRARIIGDEPVVRERIRLLLCDEPDIELIGECPGSPVALVAVKNDPPDLLFLDMEMSRKEDFNLLCVILQERQPMVVITVATHRSALRAFDAQALDHLLKSFRPARFKKVVQRAREHLAHRWADAANPGQVKWLARSPHLTRVVVKTGEKIVIIKTAHIDCIESAGNYIAVQSGKESYILRETLNALEARLDPKKFLRISRSAIVNLDRVKELQPMFQGEHVMVLHNGKHLTMTRSLREVEEALKFS